MSPQNIRWRIPILVFFAFLLTVDGFAKTAEQWYREGVELSLDGSQDRAVKAFQQALKIKPDWAEAHHALGVQYFTIRSGLKGISHLRKAARYYRERSDPQARKNLSIVENNLDKAYARLNVDPDDFDTIELDPGYTTETQWQTVGAGFLIGGKGFLLAPNNNIKDAQKIRVRFANGNQSAAKLVKSFVVYNIAVLKLEDAKAVPKSPLSFGNDRELREGNLVYLIDLQPGGARIIQGPILAINALEGNKNLFHLGLPLKPSHRGGPILNGMGKVVGMAFSQKDIESNFARMKDVAKDTSFALKSSYMQTITANLFKSEMDKGAHNHSEATQSLAPKFQLNAVANNVAAIEISLTP